MTTPQTGVGLDGVRVLVVEDDAVIREATTLGLEMYGLVVQTAPDGLAGWTAYRQQQPDVLILDVMMPFLDGISLCRRIRETSAVPILMLSARSDGIDIVPVSYTHLDVYKRQQEGYEGVVSRLCGSVLGASSTLDQPHPGAVPPP